METGPIVQKGLAVGVACDFPRHSFMSEWGDNPHDVQGMREGVVEIGGTRVLYVDVAHEPRKAQLSRAEHAIRDLGVEMF